MTDKYWITGVQLGMLACLDKDDNQTEEILKEIMTKQEVDNSVREDLE